MLNDLNKQQDFVVHLINNLSTYCEAVKARVQLEPGLIHFDRTKIFPVSKKHSHHDEIRERLIFLKYYATQSDFEIGKAELKIIYDLLSKSPIMSDIIEFFSWLKEAYEEERKLERKPSKLILK